MRKAWTQVQLILLREHYAGTSTAILAQEIGRTASSCYVKAQELGLRKDPAVAAEAVRQASTRMHERAGRAWTVVQLELLRERYATCRARDLAPLIGKTERQIHAKAKKLGLKKDAEFIAQCARERMSDPSHPGRAHQFKPGLVPANKGVKHPEGWGPGRMRDTQFKPGVRPHTWKPVGSLRVNSDGYLDRKVNELPGPSHVRWHPVHRLVWEEANGPVPKGHVVVFKVGRKTTVLEQITLDAIELITREQLMQRNTIHNLPDELRDVMRLRGTLNRKINALAKEAEDHEQQEHR